MNLIVNGGAAKSGYIEAIRLAKGGNFDDIQDLWNESNQAVEIAHKTHFEMLNSGLEAGTAMEKLLLIHAEDQLNSAEIFKVISEEMVDLYKIIEALK
ncbi:PTS lactose/cellobiose transporter subunit IIA [Breznakia pachnodae]|uniref:PTS system cellobiose-specific IIA component n=1 Tax=Breznakia pachnodae TaxID=265178 RepID=A0ABU0E3L4_9FIRM|nr:PTS lactose/cellobiose transporter subunit IIA [Breznakia pachnodae]MDQ0361477.1 PTS system cellobiose-specific IIA component [Breznakia pachnodae]